MKRAKNTRAIMAAAAAIVASTTLFNRFAAGASFSWSATPGSNVASDANNWMQTGGPVLPGINDATFFGGSTQTSLSFAANMSFGSITFNADAPAYTIGDVGGTASITLGTTTPSFGNITNNSNFTQTFNTSLALRVGNINAANADIVFNGATFNIGNNSNNNAGRNITFNGSHNVTINGALTGTPAVTGTTPNDGSTNFGQIIMSGTGVLALTNDSNNPFFTGRITVNSGALRANVPNAFGANGTVTLGGGTIVTMGTTHVSGGTNTGRVELTGGVSFAPETLVLEGRTVTDTQLLNFSGNNTWTGPVNLATGGGLYAIQSDSGSLTISGNITNATGGSGSRNLSLRGASNGLVSGNILEGTGASNFAITKDGAGSWTLTGSNNYTGGTTISAGTLQIGNGGTSGNLGTGSVVNNANLVFNRSDAFNVTNAISGSGNVVHAANSQLTLAGNLSYTGATAVQAGTLVLSTAKTGGGAITVADGAALTLNSASTTTTLAASSFTLGGGGGSTLNFALGTAGNPTVPIVDSGGLTRNGSNIINIQGSNFAAGTITLIQYAGAEAGSGSFTLGQLPNRVLASLIDTGSKLDLHISGIDLPKWTGAFNSTWDTSNNAPPKNWVLNSNGTTPTDYLEGDSTLFDDSSSNNTVNITNNVSPNAIAVNNSTKNYLFTGNGAIGGPATLTKTGTGTLTIANSGANTFSGTISIGASGTLQVGAGTTSGSLGSGPIVNNGTLALNRSDGVSLPNNISGTGALIVKSNSSATLSGTNTYDGRTTVQNNAVLSINSASSLGSTAGMTLIETGGSIQANSASIVFDAEPMTINGAGNGASSGAIHVGGGTVSTFTGQVNLGSSVTLQADGGATGILSGPLSGAGLDITVDGGGTWVLAGANTYANTIVNNGTLSVGNGGASGTLGSGSVLLNGSGANLNFNRSDLVSVANLIDGSGNIVKSGGGTVVLTSNNTFTGSVTINQGVIRATSNNAFGTGAKNIVADTRNKGIELDGGVTIPNTISFTLSNDGDLTQGTVPFSIHSVTGTNTINGDIGLKTGGGNGLLRVDAGGTFIVNSNISIQQGQGARSIGLGGSGVGVVNGVISDGPTGEAIGIVLAGNAAPSWTLTNANLCTGNVSLQSGTLTLMNNQALGFTAGTFCFIGNGGGAFAGVAAALNIGADGLTVANSLWTNRDGAGSLQSPTAVSTERFIGFSGASGTGTFSGQVQINGGAVFRATPSGTLVMSGVLQNGTEQFSNGGRNDVFVNADGTVIFTNSNTYTGVTTVQHGKLILKGSGAQNPVFTGAGADVQGGRLILDYNDTGTPPDVKTILTAGFGQTPKFSTGQIRTSNPADSAKGLGWTDNPTAKRETIAYTYYGDANLDGQVDVTDLGALATNWQTNNVWSGGDFDYSGFVDVTDLGALATNWQQGVGNPLGRTSFAEALAAVGLGGVSVPEPASVMAVGLCAVGVASRRARRARRA